MRVDLAARVEPDQECAVLAGSGHGALGAVRQPYARIHRRHGGGPPPRFRATVPVPPPQIDAEAPVSIQRPFRSRGWSESKALRSLRAFSSRLPV
ncbi:hypothetical protein AB0C33_13655 [Nonomuraea sp. NPDC048881]|uniref:hypothetical protein n=1 Tax=Nonomuraea sp. NPDC048881 TaxID=3155030 RepID=UPI0033CE4320